MHTRFPSKNCGQTDEELFQHSELLEILCTQALYNRKTVTYFDSKLRKNMTAASADAGPINTAIWIIRSCFVTTTTKIRS